MISNIPILSTFSGGGLLDIGFMDNGFQVEGACEIEAEFIRGYNSGVKSYLSKTKKKQIIENGIKHVDIDDITDISLRKTQIEITQNYKDKVEGIIGGPPCQDYSVGGKNVGVTGDRGKLIFSYLEMVKRIKPSFIFFENVSGLLNTKNHSLAFSDLVDKLREEAGYFVDYKVLNSLDYGVPQDRARLVLVGFRKDIQTKLLKNGYELACEDPYDDKLFFRWPKKTFINPKDVNWPKEWRFGGDVIKEELEKIPQKYLRLTVEEAFKGLTDSSPNQTEYFNPYSSKFYMIGEGDTYRKSFKRLHRYRYSPTVAYGNNEVHLHPTEARRLSVREALRLQSVPDSYILPDEMTLTDKFKLIGNGVSVKKASKVAAEIRRTLENYQALS